MGLPPTGQEAGLNKFRQITDVIVWLLWFTHGMALICSQDEEIGGFMIQQNVAGRPVTVFRFPPRTRLKALSHATVSIAITSLHLFSSSPPIVLDWAELHNLILHITFLSIRCFNIILIWFIPRSPCRCGQQQVCPDTILHQTSCGKTSTSGELDQSVLQSSASQMDRWDWVFAPLGGRGGGKQRGRVVSVSASQLSVPGFDSRCFH